MFRKKYWIFLLLLLLAGGCRERGSAAAAVPVEAEPEAIVAHFNPAFTEQAIPPEVEARMRGNSYPENATVPLDELRYLRLAYYDFEGRQQMGEMVCNKAIAQDLLEIFRALYEAQYPICSIRLVDDFGGSDDASMEADNTSCFNFRTVPGQRNLSRHALGMAVDVNPLENPYITRRGQVMPAGAEKYVDRTQSFPHKIDRDDLCYRLFQEHGFSWGGAWQNSKDYQHFQK